MAFSGLNAAKLKLPAFSVPLWGIQNWCFISETCLRFQELFTHPGKKVRSQIFPTLIFLKVFGFVFKSYLLKHSVQRALHT